MQTTLRSVPALCVLVLVAFACLAARGSLRAPDPAALLPHAGERASVDVPAWQTTSPGHAGAATPSPEGVPVVVWGEAPLGQPDPLQGALEAALGAAAADVGVVVLRPGDGRSAAIGADRVFYAASLYKLAVLYEVALRLSTGTLTLDDPLPLRDADLAEDLGTAARLPIDADGTLPVGAALAAMITWSDNATAVAFLRALGHARIDTTLAGLGLTHTSVNTPELPTTAGDMARLMAALVTGTGLQPDVRDLVRELLLGQETRTGIPAGVPGAWGVGNKTGTWHGATHDVAFVDAPGGLYVIAVLTGGSWDWQPIRRASEAAFRELAGPALRE